MRIRRNLILRALIPASLATALLCSGATATPCAHWLGGLLTKPVIGADLPVYAMTYWNPGNGSPPLLVAGGTFGFMNGVNAQYIAAWDGLVWRPLGNSIPGPVFSLTVFNGQLVAGGTRSTLSSGQQPWVARWTGAAWLDLGGVSGSPDTVYALAVYNGSLIAGGKFDGLCPNIESYDGSSWHPMGAGTDGPVRCLKVYNNTLYAGGIFKTAYPATVKNFASWNGTTWSGVGIGNPYMPTGPVYSMALHGGELFVGQGPPVPSTAVVRWNGSNWNGATGICSTVRALEESNGILYAGGDFWVQPGCPANHVAQWTGSGWTSAGTGISTGGVGPGIGVLVLKDYGGALFAGGDFLGSSLNNIAAWNGSWQSPYAPSNVYCIAGYGSKVAMGGYFYDYNLGGYYLVNWDGTGRSLLGSGVDGPVLALLGYSTQNGAFTDNHLVAGGAFTHANGGLCNYVAQWTESNQYPFNTWGTLGSGFNAGVDALEMFRGNIVAGGAFTLSGATSVNHIARWTGSAWQAMGSAMNGTVRALKTVSTLSVTTIIAAGDFTTANGAAANHIATWSENYVNLVSPWAPMGSGFNSTVFAVEKYGTSTYAGGQFTASGTTALNSIGRWTGSAWVQVGSATAGGGFNGPVYALRSEGGYLYAAGSFTSADGVPVQNVARWNGSVWSAVDVGTDAVAFALYPYHGEVLTGGNFTWAESNASSAYGVARFSENGIPWLARQPVSANVTQGQALFFSTQPASGYSNLTYQWRKDDVPLNDGTTPQGSSLRGTTTANLYVSNIVPADSGSYDCVVTNACGSITTTLATLGVTATTAVPFAGGPSDLGLTVHPNPARGSAEIDFHIPPATEAEADIYDSAGRRVRRLLAGTSLSAGERSIHWDGKDDDGREVGAGVYYARVAAGGAVAVRKTAIVR